MIVTKEASQQVWLKQILGVVVDIAQLMAAALYHELVLHGGHQMWERSSKEGMNNEIDGLLTADQKKAIKESHDLQGKHEF